MTSNVRRIEEAKNLAAYQFMQEEYLEDLKSLGLVFQHKKSGARVVVLSNEDENKVFSIGFRTPPTDSTGVAHIIEHTVLCGSKEFPAKDPFVELVKGSLNTFLNAMTYSDKTIYPVASCNDKDFQNLMHVYLDAVFYPNIYEREEIFKQEGWHYELENPEEELQYNGVVYNEMKGVFSSPEQQLYRLIQQSLFPDTAYGTESGGDPSYIPDLTYAQYLEFHKKYYHPSNSYIYLYGDMNIEEKLNWIDEKYLAQFSKIEVDSAIKMQKPFAKMQEYSEYYSLSEGEATTDKTYLSYNVVVDTSLNKELYVAFQILEYVLLDAPGAPLKQALIDAGIGKDILASYDNGILQPVFSIIAKDTEENKKQEFLTLIQTVLKEIIETGFDEKALKGALHYFEFKYREADFGHYPKGLMYGIQILDSWLYEDSAPFLHMSANQTFALLKEKIGTGYYEELVRTYLIENTHSTLVIVKPKVNLTLEMENQVKEKLAAYKAGLSQEEIQKLVDDTAHLKLYQETPSTKEELEKIPMLSRSDISKEIMPLFNEEKRIGRTKVIHHNIFTNGIGYLRMSFGIDHMRDKAPYLALLATVLGYTDTKNYSYLEFANETNIHTGGISTDVNGYSQYGEADKIITTFEIKTKVLYENMEIALQLIKEMMFESNFENEKRLKEIIAETKSRLQMKMNGSGHTIAVGRAMSYFSNISYFTDQTEGIGYYRFLEDLDENFEEKKEELIATLKSLTAHILKSDKLLLSYTADENGYAILEEKLAIFTQAQENMPIIPEEMVQQKQEPKCFNEGFKTAGQVQYVARAGNFKKAGYSYTGLLRVLKVILSYDYLWNNVRVKGGAYGCMCGFNQDGNGYFVSYRDPNLSETNEIYEKTYEYIKNFTASERDITKYIIGTISSLDTPLSPSAKGIRSFTAYMSQITEEIIQKNREEVLNATEEDIRNLAPLVKTITDAGNICVIGNENKIEENKELFGCVLNLTH